MGACYSILSRCCGNEPEDETISFDGPVTSIKNNDKPRFTTFDDSSSQSSSASSLSTTSKGLNQDIGKNQFRSSTLNSISIQSSPQPSLGTINQGFNQDEEPSVYENSRRVIALYDYQARSSDELSFKKDDIMEFLGESNHEDTEISWLKVMTIQQPYTQGVVPVQYVTEYTPLSDYPWYFGDIDRKKAEIFLKMDINSDCSFLVRKSNKEDIQFVISESIEGTISHRAIRKKDLLKYKITKWVEEYQNKTPSIKPCTRVEEEETIVTQGLSYQLADEWEIPRESIELYSKIGSGAEGEVFDGMWNKTVEVAVKKVAPGKESKESLLREAKFLKRFHSYNLVQLYGVCTLEEPYYMVLEFMPNGNLLNYLRSGPGKEFKEKQLVEIAAQVSSGMSYLESKQVIHCDLAARNILVGKESIYKISDFGMASSEKPELRYSNNERMPVRWCAPEVLKDRKYSTKSDVWSFGICLVEIFEKGMIPYPGMSNFKVKQRVLEGHRMSSEILSKCSGKIFSIMNNCWKEDPEERPSFSDLNQEFDHFYADFNPYNPGFQ